MARQQVARAKSISWTAHGSQSPAPPTGPIDDINSYSTNRKQEMAEFLKGTARVGTSYRGKKNAQITIETADIATIADFEEGMRLDAVTLTLEGAIDSGGTAVGDDVVFSLSEAVVSEIGELAKGNEDSAPVVQSITFKLDRHPDSDEDPEWSFA